MAGEIIQADYQQLEDIARRFQSQMDATNEMANRVTRAAQVLANGSWQGRGAKAFTAEMSSEVMPAVKRLIEALGESSTVTTTIAQTLRQAEEEAAALFNGGTPGMPGSVPGVPGGVPGVPGAPPGSDPATPGSGSTDPWFNGGVKWGGSGSIWKMNLDESDGKFAPSAKFKFGVEGSIYDDGLLQVAKGGIGVQAGVGEKGFSLGPYGEFTTVQVGASGTVLGDKNFGLTLGGQAKALSVEGFAGIKDNSIGASIGGTLISAKGEVGTNIAGVNVGVNGEIGLKAELGFKIGQKTEIKLPFVTIGFSFGGAKD